MPIQTLNELPAISASSEAADRKHALSSPGDGRLAAAEAGAACAAHCNQDQRLRSLFGKTKEAIIWSLVDHANRALSDSEVQQLTADLLAVNQWASRFEDELLSLLFTSPAPAAEHRTDCNTRADEGEGLSLLDNETHERALAEEKLAAHLREHFKFELAEISELRAAPGSESPRTYLDQLPTAPARLAQSLTHLADVMELALPSRRIVFEAARVTFERELRPLYRDLATALQEQGPTPGGRGSDLRGRRFFHAVKPDAGSRVAEATKAPALQPRNPTAAPEAAQDVPNRYPTLAEPPLVALWTQMPSEADRTPSEIIEALDRAAVAQGFEQGLNQNDRRRVQLATQLWDLVQNDRNLSSSPESWRQRLELPLLAAVTTDPEFFARHDHPIRVLIDRLDELSELMQSAGDGVLSGTIRDTVEYLTTQLNSPTPLDRSRLEQLAGAIEDLAEGHSQKYQRNVDRVVEACTGRNRLRHCQNLVQSQLVERYEGKYVPPAFAEVLSAGWQTLLEITLVKQGEDGPEHQAHWETLDALVQRLGGEPYQASSQLPDAATLCSRLAAGLQFAGADPRKWAALLQRLSRVLAESSATTPNLLRYTVSGRQAPAEPPAPEGVTEGEWRSALERTRDLKVGDIVVVSGASEDRKRLKLAWIGDHRWLFTLVDRRGFKAADLTQEQLATKLVLRQMELEPAGRRPLTERVIDQLLDRLRGQVDQQAATDPLTGLNTASRFESLLARALMDAQQGVPHVLCWIDIDQFTVLRNTFGLEAADQLRVVIARLLKKHFAGKGILAYLGGDQFAATVTRGTEDSGLQLAEAFRKAVIGLSFSWERTDIPVSVSVGVIGLAGGNVSCTDVLQAADATIFSAKSNGGNRCLVYNGNDGVIHRRKSSMQWLQRVDQAMARGCLDLRCQRIAPVNQTSGLVPHYEVLLGIRDEDGEPLDISQFIAAAERYSRMGAVDRWVARTAFEWAAEHPLELERLGGLAINLSGQSMNDEGIVEFLKGLLNETGVAPERISFEATETVAITDLNRASHIIRAIRGMGCSFALDDFGSGYASYAYLRQLPVDWLKIDGAFVRGIHRDPTDYGVVRSIHEIGHFMGKRTIGEYVEDDAILERLRQIGVDYAQGYEIERPRRLADLV
jgi:diguanylate cyclase (GGDEF)-like protein